MFDEVALESLVLRAVALENAKSPERVVIGIAGAPGSGKSTVTDAFAARLGDQAMVFRMDGFHLDDSVLDMLGRSDRKGAPDTFDVDGFVCALARLRTGRQLVFVPEFDRARELSRAAAVAIEPAVRIVVVEGNYLLSDEPGWSPVRELLDETWWVHADDVTRLRRLIQRHVDFGRSREAAEAWVLRSDEANAALVAADSRLADLMIDNSGESAV